MNINNSIHKIAHTFSLFLTLIWLSFLSEVAYAGALNFHGGECIPATIIEPIYEGVVFMGFTFKSDSLCISEDELPVYHSIDAEFSDCANDTIILIKTYNKYRKILETRLMHDGPRWSYGYNGDVIYYGFFPTKEIIEDKSTYYFLMGCRSEENLDKTITSWQLDSIAEMLLYSGDPYRNTLGYIYCDRIITNAGKISYWERIVLNNVFDWFSPSLIEQMAIEFEEDKNVIFAYKHYLNNQIKRLQKEDAPIEDIKSRKFWRYEIR